MPATYEPIATTTLGSAASSITFSSIPGTYTDLRLVLVGTYSSAGGTMQMTFNSDSAANYSYTALNGNGTSAISFRTTGSNYLDLSANSAMTNTQPTFYDLNIFSYAGNTNKTVLNSTSADRNGSGSVGVFVGLWRNTAAVTSFVISLTGQTFATGTTATLYGILKA